jgi:hypothetical protein
MAMTVSDLSVVVEEISTKEHTSHGGPEKEDDKQLSASLVVLTLTG